MYQLKKEKEDLTFEEKRAMVDAVNAYANLESYWETDAEEALDCLLDDVLEEFQRLLDANQVDDWYDLFEEIDDEDAGEYVPF